jgi:hypothetical protein
VLRLLAALALFGTGVLLNHRGLDWADKFGSAASAVLALTQRSGSDCSPGRPRWRRAGPEPRTSAPTPPRGRAGLRAGRDPWSGWEYTDPCTDRWPRPYDESEESQMLEATVLVDGSGAAVRLADGAHPAELGRAAVAALFLLRCAWAAATSHRTVYTVTDRRIIERSGVFSRYVTDRPVAMVATVDCRRSLLGGLLGYGRLGLVSAPGAVHVTHHSSLLGRLLGRQKPVPATSPAGEG